MYVFEREGERELDRKVTLGDSLQLGCLPRGHERAATQGVHHSLSIEYQPTGKHFGGVYSRSTWARFVEHLPAALDVVNVPDREPPGATDEAVAAIKQRK